MKNNFLLQKKLIVNDENEKLSMDKCVVCLKLTRAMRKKNF